MFKDFHDKYKCIFIHVPKVAGSSIERVIYQTDKWLVGHVKASDYIKIDKDKFESYFSFGFVRNPYDRVVSAYHYLRNGGGTLGDEKWAKENIYKYNSFKEFVLDLQNTKIQNKVLNWIHFIPQYKFLCDNEKNILVNFFGKFENLEEDFQKILKILSRKDELVHINKSNHIDYKNYYNDAMYKIVREIYRDDFEIFDYDLEDRKYFNISQYNYLKNLENKITMKNTNLEFLRLGKFSKIQNLNNNNIKLKEQTIQNNLTQIQNLNNNIKLKEQTIQNNLTQIQNLNNNIKLKEQTIQNNLTQIQNLNNNIKLKEQTIQNNLTQIQNLNNNIKLKEQTIQNNLTQIQNLNNNIKLKEQTIQNNLTQIQNLNNNIKLKEQTIQNKDNLLFFQTQYGIAKTRIQNQLSYKLGQAMIANSKSLLGYIRMPFVLSYIKDKHKQEQKIYQEKIKKDPSLKLPPLEDYPDYKEAIKEKECLTYRLGQTLIKADQEWYKGGYVKMWFEIRKLKKEYKKK